MKKAEKFLKTAELALDSGDYDSCASRCYYAMFFMAEAALLTKSLWASTHKGVISLFGEHFVKTGIFEREIGKSLTDVHDKRLVGDYGVGFTITLVEAEFAVVAAKKFVHAIKNILMNRWTWKAEPERSSELFTPDYCTSQHQTTYHPTRAFMPKPHDRVSGEFTESREMKEALDIEGASDAK